MTVLGKDGLKSYKTGNQSDRYIFVIKSMEPRILGARLIYLHLIEKFRAGHVTV
ncbi:hypothetical protein [Streptosporangium sp. NBC_01469]|uniref:hypothetical protein n=1 Tax=Streptosporangium sp. NBC_01469 TaxID=2903898 RepID=UPI002E27D4B3|nr:hypothetical protein [Streptosporangium sp. NBC_01469]